MVVFRMGESLLRLQTCALLALPLMLYPSAGRWKMPQWVWYAAYPGHLAILKIIEGLIP